MIIFLLMALSGVSTTWGSRVIGIDLGTTYSCVAVMKNGRVEVLSNDQGNRITPSYVAFTEDGERLIGDAAKNQLTSNPKNTIFDAKRLIGRDFSEDTVQKDLQFLPFKVFNQNGKVGIEVAIGGEKKILTPEEVSAMVLTKMKSIAEEYLGEDVTEAVVTVPAYFNDAQRTATKDAGKIAGLNVLRIINEPTAAAIAYGLDVKSKTKGEEKDVLVFDLGGGTFDVSLLTISDGVFEVLATSGDTHLGGEDFDQRVMDHFITMLKKKTGKDVRKDDRALQKLRREVEKAKRALSSSQQTRIEIESLIDGQDFSETLTRAKFEELNMDLFKSTMTPVKKVLEDGGLTWKDVGEVVLVGGSTRIPKIQQLVKDFFHGKEPSHGVNPDEAVAYGAAVQACILSKDDCGDTDMVIIDTIPLTLGIEMVGGVMANIITRNTPIPAKKSQIFSTAEDNQNMVVTAVYEGERPMVVDNHFLGKFDLNDIPNAPRGVPQIEVTFRVNADGILEVSAKDLGTDNQQSITISNDNNRLSPEDIEKMLKEAEKMEAEDKIQKERIESRNELEQYSYSLKRQVEDKENLGGKISEDEKIRIMDIVNTKLSWLRDNEDGTGEQFKEARKEIEDVAQPIITKLYSQQKKTHSEDEL